MKTQTAKPTVAPPASYKAPALPTLAALGILTAATTLTTGCRGVMKEPEILGGITAPREWHEEILDGVVVSPELPAAPSLPTQYRVGSTEGGGTLSGIAKIFYGDASKWPAIYEANKATIKDPHIIRDGMLITIPKLGE